MTERRQRFDAICERVNEMEKRVNSGASLSTEEKTKIINECIQCCISLGHIALETMEEKNEIRH